MSNLRDRLRRIQEQKKNEAVCKTDKKNKEIKTDELYIPALTEIGWQFCGYNVLKKTVSVPLLIKIKKNFPEDLGIIIPDFSGKKLPVKEDLLFFDLETTGLSGGAGTIAFLVAFGKISSTGKLYVTQYLLLDYPGENDFLENVLNELKAENKVIVTYNGKCFDSQIIKTRCLMNRIKPPEYRHADLLHPARRLWKNLIQDCSQGSIERQILNINRIDDIPGSLAPEIWFEFLKTGKTERLIGICEHNVSDIYGLASILSVMISIAENLFNTDNYDYDLMRLARTVYSYAYEQMKIYNYKKPLELIKKGIEVLEPDSYWRTKLKRRKTRLEKLINQNNSN
ncbi:MAG: ribonuclease H-like domain-containing protein [Treponema sp.]|nr:ribonuclease H-like domain-containing protein [Treponema sp.]